MSYILNIDTAVTTASVCLSRDAEPLYQLENPSQKDQAAWLHPALQELVQQAGISLQELDAIAISAGPGSYTGLRVGMSAAKGLCYALGIPLLLVSTLKMMAVGAGDRGETLLCPMIDARRMEVFTAIYDRNLSEILSPVNLILDEHSFSEVLDRHSVIFFGNGSAKFQNISQNVNARFLEVEASAKHMSVLSFNQFSQKNYADLAYAEPFYGKDFHLVGVKA
ncbi:MAG: tRNA (adenosine(37)-N6)-threonylcarbamoyltransferase complex dimerization subunit type 1 TsaB [Flavisolibacter sp.]